LLQLAYVELSPGAAGTTNTIKEVNTNPVLRLGGCMDSNGKEKD